MKEKEKEVLKANILEKLEAILAEIRACIRNKTMPPTDALANASSLIDQYPYEDDFKEVIKARLEEIKKAEELAKEVAEKKIEEDRAVAALALAAELKEFEEKVKKDPIGAAREYFNSAEQRQVTEALNDLLEGKTISDAKHVDIIEKNSSLKNIAKETILSEHLGTKKEELEQQYKESHDLAEKNRIAHEIKESKDHLAEIGKREIHRQVVAKHEEIYKQENHVHEVTTEELVKVKGHEIAHDFKEVVHEVEREIKGGLSAIGTLVAKECEAIKEFVEHRNIGQLQEVVEEIKQENVAKAEIKLAEEAAKIEAKRAQADIIRKAKEQAEEKERLKKAAENVTIQQASVAIADTQVKEEIRQEDALTVVVVKQEEIKSVEAVATKSSERGAEKEEKTIATEDLKKTKSALLAAKLAEKRAKDAASTKPKMALIEEVTNGITSPNQTPSTIIPGRVLNHHSKE